MDPAPPRTAIDQYDWCGGRESMLRFGPPTGPVVVAAMPLFEEWNRTRAFTVTLLRALADRGLSAVLPDLPAHGESIFPVERLTLDGLRNALAAVTARLHGEGRRTVGLALRSGALLDPDSNHLGRWHLSPTTGQEMLTGLHRVWLASRSASRQDRTLDAMLAGDEPSATIAGTPLPKALLASLRSTSPSAPDRAVRLETDGRPADMRVAGRPVWRLAEPGNDPVLAARLADDIAAWTMTCGWS